MELIGNSLRRGFPNFLVSGEVVEPLLSQRGHLYFRLRDDRAEFKAVMWKSKVATQRRLPEAGEKVLVRGEVTVYPARGDLQLSVSALTFEGRGQKLQQLQLLSEKLKKEGLYDRPKRPIPSLVRRVGVVTSLGSAVIHDIFQSVRGRNPSTEVWLASAAVSGPQAPKEMIRALDLLEHRVDVVILGRGGGSFEELLGFSDESLVRRVASYSIPVIAAVGHGSDSPIVDHVADHKAVTPTAAAVLATQIREDLLEGHRALLERAGEILRARLNTERGQLLALNRLCQSLNPKNRVADKRQAWSNCREQLVVHIRARCGKEKVQLLDLKQRLLSSSPKARMQTERATLEGLHHRLMACMKNLLSRRSTEVLGLTDRLKGLGPRAILDRGFALVLNADGRLIRSVEGRMQGDKLELHLADGRLLVTIDDVQEPLQ